MPVLPGASELLLPFGSEAFARLIRVGYTRSADTQSYSTPYSLLYGGTTGRRDGFRAAAMHPSGSSNGTVTKVCANGRTQMDPLSAAGVF